MRQVEIDLPEFLSRYTSTPIIFCPNKGNAGDALIFAAEVQLIENLGLKYELVDPSKNPTLVEKTIFYSGGGNLNDLYRDCAEFLATYASPTLDNKIIILPHSIFGRQELLQNLGENVTILCRDQQSYHHVVKCVKRPENVFLSHDAVFYLDISTFLPNRSPVDKGALSAFRTDSEKTSLIYDSKQNVDVSDLFPDQNYLFGSKRFGCAKDFLKYIDGHSHVKTNRLHVSIAAGLLGIHTDLYANSYWKNFAVYEHSFKKFGLDKFVTFHN